MARKIKNIQLELAMSKWNGPTILPEYSNCLEKLS